MRSLFLKYFTDRLPVPYIIQVLKPTSHINSAVLMEYLEGIVLKKEALTDSLAKDVGSLLAKIHINKASGYGDLTKPNNLSPHASTYFNFKFEEEFDECKGNLPNKLLDECRIFYTNNINFLDFVDGPCTPRAGILTFIPHKPFINVNILMLKIKNCFNKKYLF